LKNKKLSELGKQIESSFKFFVGVYCRSVLVTYVIYYLAYILESMFVQKIRFDEQANLLWIITFCVSFFVTFILGSTERKIERPQSERRLATFGEIFASYIKKNFVWEIVCFVTVVFGSMMFRNLFPFCITYKYTSQTVGFILCSVLTAVMQILGISVAIKSKRPKSSYAPWYKLSLWMGVTFLLFLLFTPTSYGSEPRNIPLFYAFLWIAIITFMVRFLIRVIRLSSYANKLKLHKARDVKCNYFKIPRRCDISYTMRGERVNVAFLYRVEKMARHYFEDAYTIRRFLGMAVSNRSIGRARLSRITSWMEIGEIRLPWREIKENERYILVWKNFPSEIADENSRENTIGNNDLAANKILILKTENFKEYIAK